MKKEAFTMELIVVETPTDIEKLKNYLIDKEYISFDIETTGLYKEDTIIGLSVCAEHDVAYYIIIHKWDAVNNQLNPTACWPKIIDFVKCLVDKNIICHNAIFDCSMVHAHYNVDLMKCVHTDTMILAHLLNENRKVGLKELAKEYFGEDAAKEQQEMRESVLKNGGKLTKSHYEMYKADPYLMGKYGAKDAMLTYRLFYELVPELYAQKLDKFFYEDESMPMLRGPTYQLNTVGLKIDQDKLLSLKKTLEAECLEAKNFIYREIDSHIKEKYPGTSDKTTFNIGSSSQLSWLLFDKLNLEFNTLTREGKNACKSLGLRIPYTRAAKNDFIGTCQNKTGKIYKEAVTINGKKAYAKKYKEPWSYIACDKKTLTKLAPKYEWIKRLLEYQRKTKILTTYVEGIQERIKYGIIQPSFLQHGTTSGRYSSRNPNFQNLPRDDRRIKECIVSRPGKSFVGADYSQLEPRVFAYFSKDKRLLEAFRGTDDFYSVIGMEVYEKHDCIPRKDGSPDAFGVKYKKLRDLSKVIALASTYGATAHQLSSTTGKNIEDTQADIDSYFEKFPGVKDMMLEAHKLAKENGQVENIFGRPRRMPGAKNITKLYGNSEHSELPYEIRNVLNLAVNHRIQSTGASIVNRAAIRFHDNCLKAGLMCKLVLQVHDSLVIECDEKDAEDISILLQDAMENTTIFNEIALEAVPKIGKNLAEV